MSIARAIRKGWIKPKTDEQDKPQFYDIWSEARGALDALHIPAPKMALPGNEESYNPPAEYLKSPQEIQAEQKESDRPIFVPKKFSNLRSVPLYDRFIQERFERCLDLYLCPRVIKKKIHVDPESLIPKLPNPKDLEPYPSKLAITYKGHTDKVVNIQADPLGAWIASASLDKTVRIFEVATGRCQKVYRFDEAPCSVSWNPSKSVHMLAIAVYVFLVVSEGYWLGRDNKIILVSPGIESKSLVKNTEEILTEEISKNKNNGASWTKASGSAYANGFRMTIECNKVLFIFISL